MMLQWYPDVGKKLARKSTDGRSFTKFDDLTASLSGLLLQFPTASSNLVGAAAWMIRNCAQIASTNIYCAN